MFANDLVFDMSLNMFISDINGKKIVSEDSKKPKVVLKGDIVTYTIRVYNEGHIDGHFVKIMDYIPSGLEYIADNEINIKYKWEMLFDKRTVVTEYLQEEIIKPNSYKEVQIVFRVTEENTSNKIIANIAEIKSAKNEYGLFDVDSTPDNFNNSEDDIDLDRLKLQYFDLAINITAPKKEVVTGEMLNCTIRVSNNALVSGNADEIKVYIPDGLKVAEDSLTNEHFGWKVRGNIVITEFLKSKNQIIKGFDKEIDEQPDYKEIHIVFEVCEPKSKDRVVTIKAEITKDSNEFNLHDVSSNDRTSETQIRVKYFDFALSSELINATVITVDKQETLEKDLALYIEVDGKIEARTIIKYLYKIQITNEGEIPGYAKEIVNYIPEGMIFKKEDNPGWEEIGDKIILTKALSNRLLNPGETVEIQIILTWDSEKSSAGMKRNVVELGKVTNDSNTIDIDSTPNNKKNGEDDFSFTEMIVRNNIRW